MLQFIIGRARSGKSYQITERIAKCVKNGETPILLVPEQASFENEKLMLNRLGDSDSKKVTVLSFSRLCDEVERLSGGGCAKLLRESDKLILMSRAIKKAQSFSGKKQSHGVGYARLLVDTIGEFKLNAVGFEELKAVSSKLGDSLLSQKLNDVAEIYLEYDALVGKNFIDPSDRLTRLYNSLETFRFFEGKTVFVDGFKGFTGQQFKILGRVLSQSENVTVTLTCDGESAENFGTFSNIVKTKRRIEDLARARSVGILSDIYAGESRFESAQLREAERLLCGKEYEECEQKEDIVICKAQSVFDEAEFVARNIRRLVRLNKARYRDIVIIARNPQDYSLALKSACEKNSVNCFIDSSVPLAATPAGAAVIAASELLLGITTERILRFFKASFALFSLEELSALENYVYLWGIDGRLWEKEWDMDPKGFVMQEDGDTASEELSYINGLRTRAMAPILKMRSADKTSAAELSRAIVGFLKDCRVNEALLKLCEHYDSKGETALSSATRKAYDDLMLILNSMAVCFDKTNVDAKEYCDTLKSCIIPETVETVPQTIDEVIFGAADKIRPNDPKYVFILGANQGVFPSVAQNSGIFGSFERKKIIELGIDIPDKMLDFSIDEDFLVYSSVCCASKGVYVSYNTSGEGECSGFVSMLSESLSCKKCTQPDVLTQENLPETEDTLFAALCSALPHSEQDAATLMAAAKNVDGLQDRIEQAKNIFARPQFNISVSTAEKLYGKRVRMSPSRFEDFNRCAFMYFCKHTLKIRRLEPAEFSAMQRGTMAHYVLQKLVETFGKDLGGLCEEEIELEVERFAEEYLNSISGYRSVENARMRFIVRTVTRSLKEVAKRLASEFAQSDFEPVKCELKIGLGGDMPEISVDVAPHGELKLNGIVDRVDCFEGYVRVVDYKTGHRDFKLPDLLIGQNMQMLLYLYALCKDGRYGSQPAGVLYMPAFRQRGGTASKTRMNGVINSDERIIKAMEKDNAGKFIPKIPKTSVGESFLASQDFDKIFAFLDKKLQKAGRRLYEGYIAAEPIDGLDSQACKYCDFASICRIEDQKINCVEKMGRDEVMAEIERQVGEDGI